MKFIKTTAAVMLVGLLSGVPAAFAHDCDDGDRYRPVQGRDDDSYRDHRYRDDDDDRWREYRYRHWQHEYREHYGYNHDRDWDHQGMRVAVRLPLPPLVLPPPPVIVLPRPY